MTDVSDTLAAKGVMYLGTAGPERVIGRHGTDLVALSKDGGTELWRLPLRGEKKGFLHADEHTILWSSDVETGWLFGVAAADGRKLYEFQGASARLLDGDLFLVMNAGGTHSLHRTENGDLIAPLLPGPGRNASFAVAPDRRTLVVEDEVARRTYDVRTGRLVEEKRAPERQVADPAPAPATTAKASRAAKGCPTCADFQETDAEHPHSLSVKDDEAQPAFLERLETLSSDGQWDVRRCRDCGKRYRYHQRYDYDAYGPSYFEYTLYRVADDAKMPETGRPGPDLDAALKVITKGLRGAPYAVSPDKRWLATDSQPVDLWSVEAASVRHTFDLGSIYQLEFTPDSARLVIRTLMTPQSGMEDEVTQRTFDVHTGALLEETSWWERQG